VPSGQYLATAFHASERRLAGSTARFVRWCYRLRLSHKSDARDGSLFRGVIFAAIGLQKASDRLISEVELPTSVDHRLMRQPRL
jgi:hypothetical protein